jgi:hypothetical protein
MEIHGEKIANMGASMGRTWVPKNGMVQDQLKTERYTHPNPYVNYQNMTT